MVLQPIKNLIIIKQGIFLPNWKAYILYGCNAKLLQKIKNKYSSIKNKKHENN
jgi:hypothetical protein